MRSLLPPLPTAPGITMICRGAAPSGKRRMALTPQWPFASVESLTIFDDVLCSLEQGLMCGEWQLAGYLPRPLPPYHRHSYCGLQTGDLRPLAGGGGPGDRIQRIQKATSRPRQLAEFMMTAELVARPVVLVCGRLKGSSE